MPYLNDMPLEARLAMLNRRDADRQPQEMQTGSPKIF